MKNTTRKTFDMVPTILQSEPAPAPRSLIPALPIKLGEHGDILRFSAIDTTAPTCAIASRLWRTAVQSEMDAAGLENRDRAALTIWICDEALNSWIRLPHVPFHLLDDAESGDDEVSLGYASCLENLRLTFDYPRGKFSVSAPTRLLASAVKRTTREIPRRISEGEKLLRMGSYDAAVAMLAAGLEEYLQSYLPLRDPHPTLGQLSRFLEAGSPDPEVRGLLANVMDIRRKAVHGTDREMVQRDEANKVLRAVRTILKRLPDKALVP